MQKIKVDLLKEKYALDTPNKRGMFFFTRLFLVVVIVSAVTGTVFSYNITSSTEGPAFGIFTTITKLVRSADKGLDGEKDDRVNVLLLGVGGTGHDGPELSDTIIFSSFQPSDAQIGMLSIPRDLAVPIPGYEWRKINHANAFGELEEKGSGPKLASEVVSDLLEQDINYYVKVNFDGFEELIDELGGIEVYVERSFTDYTYPTDNHLTQVVSFAEGWQKMDGETALQFARSRHGNNGEGSDFARAARQQKILLAAKDKALSTSTLLNPGRIGKVLNTLGKNIDTNLTVWEMVKLASYLPDISNDSVTHHVLDSSHESPLYATNLNGAYVLLPKNDDWTPVRTIAANIFDDETATFETETPPEEVPHFVRVEIQNGTSISGFAFQTSQLLQSQGFEIATVGNASERGFEHTVIYDLTSGTKPEELQLLQDLLAADISMTAAGWIYTNDIVPTELTITSEPGEERATEDNIDFLVILGENTAHLVLR